MSDVDRVAELLCAVSVRFCGRLDPGEYRPSLEAATMPVWNDHAALRERMGR